MAKFNPNEVEDINNTNLQRDCGMFLSALVTDEEMLELKAKWNEAGGYKAIHWCEFAFQNIGVHVVK